MPEIDVPAAALELRRQAFTPGVWTQLDEVHGTDVRRVHESVFA